MAGLTRCIPVLAFLAAFAFAEGRVELTRSQREALVEVVGRSAWKSFPAWRQAQVSARYQRYLQAPPKRRRMIERRGLRSYLVPEHKRVDVSKLPAPLNRAIKELPKQVRASAAELAFLRLRQMQFDRSLSRVPDLKRRWALFNARFPEPYDEAAATRAHRAIRREVVRAVAAEIERKLESKLKPKDVPPQERKRRLGDLVRRTVQAEQQKVYEKIRRELFRFRSGDPNAWRRYLDGYRFIQGIRAATPRQRELIRYAYRPSECPLLDMSFMGERPTDKAQRRAWEQDYTTLARLELLAAAGFPREFVLYLAGTGSSADFFRAVQGLRRAERDPQSVR